MHLSASQLSTFNECPRKWYFANVVKRVKPPSAPMIQGSLFHKAFELYYKDNKSIGEIARWMHTVTNDMPSILANVLTAFRAYVAKHPKKLEHIGQDKDGTMIEVPFEISFSEDMKIIGFIDYIMKRTVKSYITDIKCTSMALTDWYFQGFELSYQTMLYSYVCEKMFPDIAGFIIDGVQIKENKTELKLDFKQQFFPLSNNIESFEREIHATAMHILKYVDKGPEYFQHHYTSCVTKYGRCAYHGICTTDEELQIEYLKTDSGFVDKKSREESAI